VALYSVRVGGEEGGGGGGWGAVCGVDAPRAGKCAEDISAVVRGRNPVIIIIATEAVAQFTMGEPVQKLVDMLPLTSSAILMRLPVGVMFWKASLNALSRAAMI